MVPLISLTRVGNVFISPYKSVRAALTLIEKEALPGLIIMEDDVIMGAVLNLDLAKSHPNRLVLDCAIRKVSPIYEDTDVLSAWKLIRKEKVGIHPVLSKEDKLRGLISNHDIVEYLSTQEGIPSKPTSLILEAQTVLIVDDSTVVRKSLDKTLQGAGYMTVMAASGKKALKIVREEPPNLILLDVHMPYMDGYEVLKELKADIITGNIPVIMLTAMGDLENRIKAFAIGAEDYLLKPYSSKELLIRIDRLLKARVLKGELAKITEEKMQFLDQLYELREFDEKVIEHMISGLIVMDLKGKLIRINHAALNILCISREFEVLERPITDISPALKEFCKVEGSSRHREIEITLSDKLSIPLGFSSSYLIGPEGDKQGIVTIFADQSERKRAERELLESEKKYKDLVETSHDLIFQGNNEGRFTYLNPAWERTHGYKLDEMLGRKFTDFKSPERVKKDIKTFAGVMGGKDYTNYETVNVSKTGEEIHLVFNARALKDENGKVIGTQGTAHDVTERKNAEEAILKAAQEWRNTFDTITDLIMLVDTEHNITRLNKATKEALGMDYKEILGKNYYKLIYETDVPPEHCPYTKSMADGKTHKEEVYVPRFGKYFMNSSVPTIDNEGNMTGAVLNMCDVSERIQAEEERARLTTAIDQAAETILVTDISGIIQYVNPAFEKITGYSRDEAIGNNPRMLQSGEHDKKFYKDLWGTLTSGETWNGRLINRKKSGALYQEDATISPVRDTSGKVVNYVAVKHDVTEEMALQKKLLHTEKLAVVGQIAGSIAHEIKNPIFAISSGIQILQDELAHDKEMSDTLGIIFSETMRVDRLIKQLLRYGARQELNLTECDLPKMINDIVSLNQGLSRSKQITIIKTISDSGDHKLYVDKDRITQVLINLLQNAIEFSSPGESIEISCRPDEEKRCAVICVEDHGLGIPEDVREKVFDLFFSTKKGSSGMGLAISKRIVNDHGGEIYIKPGADGGTAVIMELPFKDMGND